MYRPCSSLSVIYSYLGVLALARHHICLGQICTPQSTPKTINLLYLEVSNAISALFIDLISSFLFFFWFSRFFNFVFDLVRFVQWAELLSTQTANDRRRFSMARPSCRWTMKVLSLLGSIRATKVSNWSARANCFATRTPMNGNRSNCPFVNKVTMRVMWRNVHLT